MRAFSWKDRFILAAPLLGVGLLLAWTPSDSGPTLCPFALCTGTACPGCGMTRAASQLIRGNLGDAIAYHPLVPLMALQAIAGITWFILRRTGRVRPLSNRALNLVLVLTAAALLAVWALRMASGSLPPV